jgi:adenylate cyclase
VAEHFFSQYIDTVRVKGKDIPVRIYTPMRFDKAAQQKEEFAAFNQAIALYLTRQFSKAYEMLTPLNNNHPHKLYQTYMARCVFFQENPPDMAWDGVFTYIIK